jgi:4-amino-4-deoxy-L-arabinose transferase-like glycosyltransferase
VNATADRDRPAGHTPPQIQTAVVGVAVAFVLLHWAVDWFTAYGVHRDELLYIAMGRHFTLWRMDGPPAIAAIARLSTAVFGSTVLALRILPALAGAAIVLLAARGAHQLNGSAYAQLLAALAVALSPMYLGSANLLQPVIFDQFWWTLTLYSVIRILARDRQSGFRWWVVLGVAAGCGLLTKFVIGILFFALALAALLTSAWRRLDWRGVVLALAIALAIGSPSLIGQIRLDFPIVGQLTELHTSQLTHITALDWLERMTFLAPTSLLAVIGAGALLRSPVYRPVGAACAIAFLTILLLHGKFYYAQPIFPTLWAAGAASLDRVPQRWRIWLRPAAIMALAADGLLLLPFALPVLPPPLMISYAKSLGVTEHTDKGEVVRLPSDFADMLGWPSQVAAVATVYTALPPNERPNTVILAQNYGEAAAIDFYGERLGLPHALTNQGTYYLYGPGDRSGTTAIAIGIPRETLTHNYAAVTLAGQVDNSNAVPEESHLEIFLCRGARETVQSLWPHLAGRY